VDCVGSRVSQHPPRPVRLCRPGRRLGLTFRNRDPTAGEISKTSATLLGEMPLARAWDYWKSRAGFAGL
jgi:hypothetical protein